MYFWIISAGLLFVFFALDCFTLLYH